ncbi:hypothetical protein [Hyalangium versicolor]|uniref:hypothetical protein n=1 Tax=Hyalangium versicolor TaxID=2861190 RepID=UPI001CCA1C17|nr:hypothetical protein [Hyalangium versicolor]
MNPERRPRTPPWTPWLVALGLMLLAPRSWAQSPPVVTIIPRYPAQDSAPTEVPGPEAQGSVGSLTDRQLPASQEFLLRYPASSDVEQGVGSLEVWPVAEDASRDDSVTADAEVHTARNVSLGDAKCTQPTENGRQTYLLGMVLKEEGGRKFLEAQVPALQVGQKFCFRVTPSFSLTSTQAQALAVGATMELVTAFMASTDQRSGCDGRDDAPFQAALVNALKAQKYQGNVFNVTQAAQLAQRSYLAALQGAQPNPCLELTNALNSEPSMLAMVDAQRRVLAAEAQLQQLPLQLPALRSPLVRLSSGTIVEARTLAAPGKQAEIEFAAAQLDARSNDVAEWTASLSAWATAFGTVAAAQDKTQATTQLQQQVASSQLPKPAGFEAWNGRTFVPTAQFVKEPGADLDATIGTIQLLPASSERNQWITVLTELRAARQNRDAAQKAPADYQVRLATKIKAVRDLVLQAFSREDVRRALVVSGTRTVMNPIAGIGQTPSKANFASLDLGAVFAFPGFDTWVLPYVGLNVYSVPVDRTIAPGELTGTTLERIRQRVSITIGTTLTAPTSAGRALEAPFLGRYPLIAVGYRFGGYTRLVAGSVFFNVNDPNPASAHKSLHAAPFAGASLDADLVDILTKKF